MLELIKAGGWLMLPLLLCSVIAMAIIAERFWTLQKKRIAPNGLVLQAWQWAKQGKLSKTTREGQEDCYSAGPRLTDDKS